jgi:hypothetical protein
VSAVRAAGYRTKCSKDASSVGCRIERKCRDVGLLDEELALAGVNQRAVARVLGAALRHKSITVRLQAAQFVCKLLGYDRPGEVPTALPDLPVEDISAAALAIVRALRQGEPTAGGTTVTPG